MSLERRIRRVFQAPRKGETYELRTGLVSQYAHERKDAIQRTIAAMTLGKDVSALFPDIIKNLSTHDIEQKKLVYLYLMNYAKSHPELCILAVNTFVQDAKDPNPLVRALAIRTMGCIRVDKMVDYMNIPLRETLKDDNPYVRKTAAICVAKLFDLNPELCIEEGFVEDLQRLVDDANPMVVANAVSALAEIQETNPATNCFQITTMTLNKLLAALNECTEWGRIAILSALTDYKTADAQEAEHICDRVVPQLQHANPSVVLSAIRAILAHIEVQGADAKKVLLRKMASPLVSLVSCAPEVQYVALRNILIILQKYPEILSREMRVFFCRYNDPLYLKLEKIEIMISLANENNASQLLSELKEYAMEVDIEFVRRAIKAIGQLAIKISSQAENCVNVLLDLMDNKANFVVQEVVVELRDILRKYKSNFVQAIPYVCNNLDDIEEPEARAAAVWIIGEYSDKINNAADLLQPFVNQFLEESSQVQLQLITACVKLYLHKPSATGDLVNTVLEVSTKKSDNADIRDRAYIYWRLLSSDSETAKKVVLSSKPPITSTVDTLSPGLLSELIGELSTLASVYHKPAALFLGTGEFGSDAMQKRAIAEQQQLAKEDIIAQAHNENLLDLEFDSSTISTGASPQLAHLNELGDIFSQPVIGLNGAGHGAAGSNPSLANTSNTKDILSLFDSPQTPGGFDGLSINGQSPAMVPKSQSQSPPLGQPSQQQQQQPSHKSQDDLLGLF